MDGEILDGVDDTPHVGSPSSKFTENQLFIANVTRSLWGKKLECRAQSPPMSSPIVREVPLDIYRNYNLTVNFDSSNERFEEISTSRIGARGNETEERRTRVPAKAAFFRSHHARYDRKRARSSLWNDSFFPLPSTRIDEYTALCNCVRRVHREKPQERVRLLKLLRKPIVFLAGSEFFFLFLGGREGEGERTRTASQKKKEKKLSAGHPAREGIIYRDCYSSECPATTVCRLEKKEV